MTRARIEALKGQLHHRAADVLGWITRTDAEGHHLVPSADGSALVADPAQGAPEPRMGAETERAILALAGALEVAAELGGLLALGRLEAAQEVGREEGRTQLGEVVRRHFLSGREVPEAEYLAALASGGGIDAAVRISRAPAPWTPPTPAQVRETILEVLAAPSDREEGPRMVEVDLLRGVRERFRSPPGKVFLGFRAALVALCDASPPQLATDGEWYWRTVPRDAVDGPDADERAPWPAEEDRSGWPTEAADRVERLEADVAMARRVADRERETAASYGALVEAQRQELRLAHEVIDATRVVVRRLADAGRPVPTVRSRIEALDAFIAARLEQEKPDPDAMGKGLVESQDERVTAERGPFA